MAKQEQHWLFLLLLLPAVLISGAARGVPAASHRAGLVVQTGDGQVQTACVDLGADGVATGLDVLEASGLTLITAGDTTSGVVVCKLAEDGCNFPDEACFCHCTMQPGQPCTTWMYYHQSNGQWTYSVVGASSYTVHDGDVEGWAWGTSGTQPPRFTFDDLCPAASTPTPTATPTSTTLPTATITPEPTVTTTPAVTATPTATITATPENGGEDKTRIYLPILTTTSRKDTP